MVMTSARDEARHCGNAFKCRLIDRLVWLSLGDAAAEMGCSESEVREQINAGALIAVDYEQRLLIPAFQISGGKLLPHLRATLHVMALESPWLRLSWLIEPTERLDGASPLALLERDPEAVLSAARGIGVQGGA